jgi:hypothetical protein
MACLLSKVEIYTCSLYTELSVKKCLKTFIQVMCSIFLQNSSVMGIHLTKHIFKQGFSPNTFKFIFYHQVLEVILSELCQSYKNQKHMTER